MSAPVFISYSSKDRPIARKICAAVEERGFACWMADRNVRPGEDFQIEIVRAIRSARVMLLVFTGNANESAEVRKEMALASQENLPLIPIRMEHVKPAEAFAYQLVTRQFIDLAEDWDHEIRRLTQSLEEATGIKAAVKHERVPIPDDMPLPPVSRAPVEHPPPQAMSRGGSGMAPPEVRERKAGLGDQNWALPAALTIGAALTILAVLLTRDQGVSTALRNWTPPLLAVVAIVSLIAMTLGVALLADSESDSFGEALARSLVAIGLTLIVWIIYGYSLAFAGGGDFIGGFSRAFLHEVGALELPTYTAGVTIPEWSFLIFQGCVASLASVLVVGAFGRRMTFRR